MARIADLFSSSCFSYSCFTEFALTLDVQVYFNGSTILSNPETGNKKNSVSTLAQRNMITVGNFERFHYLKFCTSLETYLFSLLTSKCTIGFNYLLR